jgi:tRNA(Ile)-lysidine synthase
MQNKENFPEIFCGSIKETILKYSLAPKGAKITVALSGGADSVALLLALNELKSDKAFEFSLSACHLNHGIRNESAKRDEVFSKELCDNLSIPFYTETISVPELCQTVKGSVETVARNERYSFFRRASEHFGNSLVATAHTMSDNAETVIFNIVRGTGTDGICGIPPGRDIFIRPLIEQKRCDIEKFLLEKKQKFMTDETNSDEEYSRNFIRINVIPSLKELNPAFEEAVFRLSESARLDRDYFDEKVCGFEKNDVDSLSKLHPSFLTRYIRNLAEKKDPLMRLSSERVFTIAEAIIKTSGDRNTRYISLPHKNTAVISENGIFIEKLSDFREKKTSAPFNIPLSFGENIINEEYSVFVSDEYYDGEVFIPDLINNQSIVYKKYIKCEVNSAIIGKGLFARPRAEGDLIRIGGMTRKLKKVYNDKHIPPEERALLPVVCDNGGNIISSPLFACACDSAKPEKHDKKIVLAFYKAI